MVGAVVSPVCQASARNICCMAKLMYVWKTPKERQWSQSSAAHAWRVIPVSSEKRGLRWCVDDSSLTRQNKTRPGNPSGRKNVATSGRSRHGSKRSPFNKPRGGIVARESETPACTRCPPFVVGQQPAQGGPVSQGNRAPELALGTIRLVVLKGFCWPWHRKHAPAHESHVLGPLAATEEAWMLIGSRPGKPQGVRKLCQVGLDVQASSHNPQRLRCSTSSSPLTVRERLSIVALVGEDTQTQRA